MTNLHALKEDTLVDALGSPSTLLVEHVHGYPLSDHLSFTVTIYFRFDLEERSAIFIPFPSYNFHAVII